MTDFVNMHRAKLFIGLAFSKMQSKRFIIFLNENEWLRTVRILRLG